MTGELTPSQTVGPFFSIGLSAAIGAQVVAVDTPGSVRVRGQVLDGDGHPVPDAVVETSQPEGMARCSTDSEGRFAIITVRPSTIPELGAAHLDVSVFARGLLKRVVTRMYFPDDAATHGNDPLLASLSQDEARTLIAAADGADLRFDIHLQGDRETVFLDL